MYIEQELELYQLERIKGLVYTVSGRVPWMYSTLQTVFSMAAVLLMSSCSTPQTPDVIYRETTDMKKKEAKAKDKYNTNQQGCRKTQQSNRWLDRHEQIPQ